MITHAVEYMQSRPIETSLMEDDGLALWSKSGGIGHDCCVLARAVQGDEVSSISSAVVPGIGPVTALHNDHHTAPITQLHKRI